MSHSGGWHRNPRRLAQETQRAREAEVRLAGEVGLVTIYAIERLTAGIWEIHPCETARRQWHAVVRCSGCAAFRTLENARFLAGPYAHAPWCKIMSTLVCKACGARPEEIAFSDKDPSGTTSRFMAKLTIRKPTDEELEALSPKKRRVWDARTFTPEELEFKRAWKG